MGAHDRVLDIGRALFLLFREFLARAALAVAVVALGVGVDRLQAGKPALVRLRQGVIGGGCAGKHRVARRIAPLVGGYFPGVEQRAATRLLQIAQVRMPEQPGILGADGLAVLDHVGNHEEFRVARPAAVLSHMVLELAETPAERNVLLGGEGLVAEINDLVLVKEVHDLAENGFAHVAGQVDAADFGAQRRAGSMNGQHDVR
ncbi:hypothetical protein D3C83_12630 [compost metagenome]